MLTQPESRDDIQEESEGRIRDAVRVSKTPTGTFNVDKRGARWPSASGVSLQNALFQDRNTEIDDDDDDVLHHTGNRLSCVKL